MSVSFHLLKIYKRITPSQRNVSTWKAASQWNNRTPSIHSMQTWALRERDSVAVTFQAHTVLTVVNYGQNETKATSFIRTRTNQGVSAAAQVQGGTCFSRSQQRTKQKGKKRNSTKQKQAEVKVPQCSFKNARRHSFCTMKNPTTKNNPDSLLEVTLS